jgi:Rieske 2Fe-2S family protein
VTTIGNPPSLVSTLPGASYTDPEVFRLEQDRIFAPLWTCAVRATEIEGPGAFKVVQVARESVIVSRDRSGGLQAFLNVCRHRGSRLCLTESGDVRRAFKCGYHAWTYGLDGRLIAAPNMASMPDIDRETYGLIPVAWREWLGYVWLCLDPEPPSFEDTVVAQVTARLGDPAAIGRYTLGDLVVGRRITYDVAANWKLIVENFMECYHCATIHPELTDVLPEFRQGFASQYFVGHGAEFAEHVEGFTVDGREGFSRLEHLGDDQDRRYFALTIRPQLFVNLVPDHAILHRVFPMAADRTLIECDWLYDGAVLDAGADLGPSVELFDRVNVQDFDACEACQLSMDSRAYAEGGVLVPSEHHIADFHAWVTGRLGTTVP